MKTTLIVKGMTNMKPTKDVLRAVARLVLHYSTFDKLNDTYTLSVSDLPDFEVHDLARLYMLNEFLASEATGPDNPAYEKSMLPALLRYMKNTSDRDEEIEFNKAWVEGVSSYFRDNMQELIDDQCNDYLYDIRSDQILYPHRRHDNGELYWSNNP